MKSRALNKNFANETTGRSTMGATKDSNGQVPTFWNILRNEPFFSLTLRCTIKDGSKFYIG